MMQFDSIWILECGTDHTNTCYFDLSYLFSRFATKCSLGPKRTNPWLYIKPQFFKNCMFSDFLNIPGLNRTCRLEKKRYFKSFTFLYDLSVYEVSLVLKMVRVKHLQFKKVYKAKSSLVWCFVRVDKLCVYSVYFYSFCYAAKNITYIGVLVNLQASD